VNRRWPAALLPRLVTVVVLVASGTYLLVYLYRWEWNRALVAGVFFLAAELALGFSIVLRRLRKIEEHIGAAEPPGKSIAEARLASTPADRPNPFAWLSPADNRLSVFVPVLLGAGAVLSALAYVAERVAQTTAGPGVDRRLSRRLDLLAPPAGGLTGLGRPPALPPPPPRRSPLLVVLALVGVALVTVVGIDLLADATQSRPDPGPPPAQTSIELAIDRRSEVTTVALAGEALWATCRPVLGEDQPERVEIVEVADDRVDIVLRPGVGELAHRRLVGCLTDLQLDLVQARVVQDPAG
jgi:hypothetical protein